MVRPRRRRGPFAAGGQDLDGRARIEAAFVELVCERGYAEVDVEAVCERAGVGVEEFERHFADLEDCLCEYIQAGTMILLGRSAEAFGEWELEGWRNQLRAVAYAMLDFLQEDMARARIMTVEVLSAGDRAQLIRDQGMEALFEFIDLGRGELEDPDSHTRATAEAVGGAIFGQIRKEIETGGAESLTALLPKMMYMAVLPYLGPEIAQEELLIPLPDAVERP
jgi:AcrR family transcriptional regulator